MWKRRLRWAFGFLVFIVCMVGVFLTWAFRQSKQVPEFYERAIAQRPSENVEAMSERLEAS
ncbi:MAG: hypothetical protein AAGJ83_11855, partial [Planctomycetota bacterium]